MSIRSIVKILGVLFMFLGGLMLTALPFSILFKSNDFWAIIYAAKEIKARNNIDIGDFINLDNLLMKSELS